MEDVVAQGAAREARAAAVDDEGREVASRVVVGVERAASRARAFSRRNEPVRAVPRRAVVVAGRCVVQAGVGAVFGLTAAVVCFVPAAAIVAAKGYDLQLGEAGLAGNTLGGVAGFALWAVIGVGFGALVRIIVPVAAGGIAVTAIFAFLASWNEFLFSLLLTSVNAKTAPIAIAEFTVGQVLAWYQHVVDNSAQQKARGWKHRGFREIIDGKHDELPEQAFYMVGTIEEAVEKAATMRA